VNNVKKYVEKNTKIVNIYLKIFVILIIRIKINNFVKKVVMKKYQFTALINIEAKNIVMKKIFLRNKLIHNVVPTLM
jgi:hypothetical protein